MSNRINFITALMLPFLHGKPEMHWTQQSWDIITFQLFVNNSNPRTAFTVYLKGRIGHPTVRDIILATLNFSFMSCAVIPDKAKFMYVKLLPHDRDSLSQLTG
jgi:hypothetical protein